MAAKSWKEAWAGDLAADLQSTVAAYASKGATQGSDQIGSRFLNETILKKMQDISECRNVTCCIGWTSPVKMSPLNEDLSFAMVAKFVGRFLSLATLWWNSRLRAIIPAWRRT